MRSSSFDDSNSAKIIFFGWKHTQQTAHKYKAIFKRTDLFTMKSEIGTTAASAFHLKMHVIRAKIVLQNFEKQYLFISS